MGISWGLFNLTTSLALRANMSRSKLPDEPPSILETLRAAHQPPTTEIVVPPVPGLRRLTGGLNNFVYAYAHGREQLVIKLYRVDDRRRADREWTALQLLAGRHPAIVPTPLWFDAHPELPAIGMSFVPGNPLHRARVDVAALRTLGAVLRDLHALAPDTFPYPYPRIGAALECVRRIEHWAAHLDATPDRELFEVVQPLAASWLQTDDRAILEAPAPAVFGRGDPNLANCLWDGDRLRLIDWEYAGWSDVAFELADLVEHINARVIPDDVLLAFSSQFIAPGSELSQRYAAAQRTCALLWLVILWNHREYARRALLLQIERVKRVQQSCPDDTRRKE